MSIWWLRILVFIFINAVVIGHYIILDANVKYVEQFLLLSMVSVAAGIEYLRKKGNYKTLGFSVSRFMIREIFSGITLAIFSLGIITAVALYFGASLSNSNWHSESILLTLCVATMEELFFRGVLQRSIEQRFGGIVALLISSIIFGLVHFYSTSIIYPAFLNIVLAGFVLGAMYMLTRSLWMSISFHAAWNYIEYSLFGRYPDPAIFSGIHENYRWWFTGEYGIEQGLCTTIILLLILVLLPNITSVSPYSAAALFKQRYAESVLTNS
ncbi:MAG: CPBP family intramembrane metalloprotease [Ignavibacteria bacterium]|nr:CPBP family intramembrane metalloprotease [Ignavibacteria bacterium]